MNSWWVNGTLLAAALAVLVSTLYLNQKLGTPPNRESMRAASNGIYAIALLVWPVIFNVLVPKQASRDSRLCFGFAWPLILLAFKLVCCPTRGRDDPQQCHARHQEIKSNAGALVGASLAIGVLLAALSGGRSQAQQWSSTHGAKLIMISLLLCISFLLPSDELIRSSYASHIVRSAQIAIFQIAIGLFITGVTIAWLKY